VTVNELLKDLQEAIADGHGEAEVLLSSDAEGNSHSPCVSYFTAEGYHEDGCLWQWEVTDERVSDTEDDEDSEDDDDWDDEPENTVPVLVLSPMN